MDIYNPQTSSEETLASTFGDFAEFVLFYANESCLDILETDLRNGVVAQLVNCKVGMTNIRFTGCHFHRQRLMRIREER
jgi:hypothetical protein